MPSPLGHALGGLAAGWLVAGVHDVPLTSAKPRGTRRWSRQSMLYGAVAMAPDLDLLFGTHSTYTHSIGAVLLVFLVAVVGTKGRVRMAAGVAAAWASHLLLDWLGSDSSAPIGIMALWPFSREHYESSLHLFEAISRRYWMGWIFVAQNAKAIAREAVILVPVAWAAHRVTRREAGRKQG